MLKLCWYTIYIGIDVTTANRQNALVTTWPWLMVSLFYGIDQRNTSLYNFLNPGISQFNLSNLEGMLVPARQQDFAQ